MEQETWIPVKKPHDLKGIFEISSEGNFRVVEKMIPDNTKVSYTIAVKRYTRVFVKLGNQDFMLSIHRLVGLHFIPNPENKPQLNHKNNIKQDNRKVNLEWCTQSENIRHAQSIGVYPYAKPKIKVYMRKEDKKHKPPIKVVNIETNEIYFSVEELCNLKGLNIKSIRRQISGERYCHVPYRYVGRENDVKFKPVVVKPVKIPFVRPPRKVYIPHPMEYRKMIMCDINGEELQTFESSGKAAEFVNSNAETFRRAVKRSPNNFTKGYVFKYA